MSYTFLPPQVSEEFYKTDEVDSLTHYIEPSVEEARESRDTLPAELNSTTERADSLWKLRRKLSCTILRNNEGSESRRGSDDVAQTVKDSPKRRRRGLSLTAPLQRLFGAEANPVSAIARRSEPALSRRPSMSKYALIRRGHASESDWDFLCQGEGPIVPPRSVEEEINLPDLSGFSWTSDLSSDSLSAGSSPTSTDTLATYAISSPMNASQPPSPTSPCDHRSIRPTKVSIENISAPIQSLPQCQGYASSPVASAPPSSSARLTSCIKASDQFFFNFERSEL